MTASEKKFKSPKAGPNLLCRVANVTPEKVCEYIGMLPKAPMSNEAFRDLMGRAWFQNIHQAPEQWGLYCLTDKGYIPRFSRDITIEEAREYLKLWIRHYPLINPYTTFKVSCDLPLVDSVVQYLQEHPDEKDLKCIIRNIIGYDQPFVLNEIIVNAINNYSGILKTKVIDKQAEKYEVKIDSDYEEKPIIMDKSAFFHLFDYTDKPNYQLSDKPLQQIFFGAPGTGKSHSIKEECDKHEHYRITFHPDTDYAAFVGAYKPTTKEVVVRDMAGHPVTEKDPVTKEESVVKEDRITYEFVKQAFLKAYIAAWKNQAEEKPKPVFLVIEEINRGNCAQIFGDIFQLLDRHDSGFSDYPISADADMEKLLRREFADLEIARPEYINAQFNGKDVATEVKAGRQLLLPDNLYIWATMNTSDQSLFPIDSAFKRRWEWKYIKITNRDKNYRIAVNGKEYDWWQFVEAINEKIEGGEIQQEDKKLGYFFVKSADGTITADRFLSKVIFYLYTDVFKDYWHDEGFFQDENGQAMSFASYFDEYGQTQEERVERFITNLGVKPIISAADTDGATDSSTDGTTAVSSTTDQTAE